ncbi:hypothetical protein [Paracraurococcus ruber]|uniref:DUF4870 domain-containing protein n=1 Tax=Paracraurococcus ruber TaxID=77675 RepID=A0ABS1D3Y4_9PROT|nr:hypothetical protein [Paracraurococcus ruber]MBK1661557.1 hypothetical protein [Paracraurococcus ruber]TDG19791.1 hypothetical protein E2C05_27385 [Paracraurococcus ruber]
MTPAEALARRRVLWMNALFAAGLAFALPWFAAGLLAHRWDPARGTLWATHHAYGVRTFWFGVIGLLAPVAVPEIGVGLLVVVWLWCAVRLGRAFLAWDRAEWIMDPGRFV